jgi:hypothetical protein
VIRGLPKEVVICVCFLEEEEEEEENECVRNS